MIKKLFNKKSITEIQKERLLEMLSSEDEGNSLVVTE